jgi:Ca2+-transporting ATPase
LNNLRGNTIDPSSLTIPTESASLPADEVLKLLHTSELRGLDNSEATRRLAIFGPNQLAAEGTPGFAHVLLNQFRSPIIWLLTAAVALAWMFSEVTEAIAIVVVLLINGVIGLTSELRALRSMAALRKLGATLTTVIREGTQQLQAAESLVPGDIVLLQAGDLVTVDLCVLQAARLPADESTFSGESLPVNKHGELADDDRDMLTRSNMLYKGSVIAGGNGQAVVTATGDSTELGNIGQLVAGARAVRSPLERRLARLSRHLIWLTLSIIPAIVLIGMARGEELVVMIRTGVALAVAAIPEGLPVVTTLALARGMWLMAQNNVLVRRLSAVETLGATTIIMTDKTGTLTENRMSVERLVLSPDQDARVEELAVQIAALCNDAPEVNVADPMEAALLQFAADSGLDVARLRRDKPRVAEEPFEAHTRMMATLHASGEEWLVAVKGAPEAVLERVRYEQCDNGFQPMDEHGKEVWKERINELADTGLRVLALATKTTSDRHAPLYSDLVFIGLIGLLDPPREDVSGAIHMCKDAGIRVIMVTGDNALTARYVAARVGIVDKPTAAVVSGLERHETWQQKLPADMHHSNIFARVNPSQKLDLVRLYQDQGDIVAMTGDGVNDAPALKQAEIGVAMGIRGTQAAQEAAEMVLKDDAFSSIVNAVQLGRAIFGNIRKFVLYLLSCNLSEVLVVTVAAAAGMPLPLLPLQILFLNLITDVFPALALGTCRTPQGIMLHPPRDPTDDVIMPRHWRRVAAWGGLITISVLTAFTLALGYFDYEAPQAVTIAFLTLALAQLWHVFNMRAEGSPVIKNEITTNRLVWGALLLCVGLLLLAVGMPMLSRVLHLEALDQTAWGLVLGFSVIPLALGQASAIAKSVIKRHRKSRSGAS